MINGIPFDQLTGLVLRFLAVLGACVGMVIGLKIVHERLKSKSQGFGPNSIKTLGIVLFLPTLILVGVVVPSFNGETLSALLGTVAGYVLSQSKPDDEK